jgi:UDP-N-acetylglucosamine--N-acetylmuramyl-(pentapeptide) pyrophosphoryl-undecaprenol N-acetylglucosamine transferase
MKGRAIIISGGGTGGHIYPALAVGRKLQERAPDLKLTYVGSSRTIERTLMEKHRVTFIPMKIEGLKGKGLKSFKSLAILPLSFFKSLSILFRLRPELVIGVGGFSSGPIVLLASWLKIPTLILEQNALPGFTNRFLIRWARKAVVAFQSSLPLFKGKGVYLGNPVREEFYSLPPKEGDFRMTLLIFGGSQGSQFLNQAVLSTLPLLRARRNLLRIYHQTGEKDFETVQKSYQENGFEEAVTAPYFYDMPSIFQKADLIISRAGATTIAELIAARKASLLIPFAQAADNHQVINARELEEVHGTELIQEKDFTPELFSRRIHFYVEHRETLSAMGKNLARLRTEKVAEKIVDLCFELMGNKAEEGTAW